MRWPQGFLPILLTLFPFSCRCLGEDALCAIRPPPRQACLSLPAFLSVPRAKDAPKSELTPPLCTLNQPLPFANFCFFQENPVPDPGLSGSERPRFQGRGNGSSIATGRDPSRPPSPLCPLFLRFRMGLRMCQRGPLLGGAQRYRGGCTPGLCPCGVVGEPRHQQRLGTESWHHPRCHWQPGLAH